MVHRLEKGNGEAEKGSDVLLKTAMACIIILEDGFNPTGQQASSECLPQTEHQAG